MPRIVAVHPGTIHIEGFPEAMAGERLHLPGGALAVVDQLQTDCVIAVRLHPDLDVTVGDEVSGSGGFLEVPAGEAVVGRTLDPLGLSLDGGASTDDAPRAPLFPRPLGWLEVAPPTELLWTGVAQVDLLCAIRRGDCRAIVGEPGSGRTTLGLTALLAQAGEGHVSIYASNEPDDARFDAVLASVRAHPNGSRVTVIRGKGALTSLVGPAAMAVAEAVRGQGAHALVVWDGPAEGKELAGITPRAGPLSRGGSVTLLVVTTASMAREHQWPCWMALDPVLRRMDPEIAGFRGSVFQGALTGWGKTLASALRTHRDLTPLVAEGYTLDGPQAAGYLAGERVWAVLVSPPLQPVPIEEQIVSVYAAVTSEKARGEQVLQHLRWQDPQLLEELRRKPGLSGELRPRLDRVIERLAPPDPSSMGYTAKMSEPAPRAIHTLLSQYASDHQDPTNQLIHSLCVPVILWTAVALIWPIPFPGLEVPGVWAAALIGLVLLFYARLSAVLGLAMVGVFALAAGISHALFTATGPVGTWVTAGVVFALAWVAQFVGHAIEGKRPSFFTDLKYLLIGPLWVVAKRLKAAGIAY